MYSKKKEKILDIKIPSRKLSTSKKFKKYVF